LIRRAGCISGCFGVFWARENARETPQKQPLKRIKSVKIRGKTENSPKNSRKIWGADTHRQYHLQVLWARCDQFQTCNQPRISKKYPQIKNLNQE